MNTFDLYNFLSTVDPSIYGITLFVMSVTIGITWCLGKYSDKESNLPNRSNSTNTNTSTNTSTMPSESRRTYKEKIRELQTALIKQKAIGEGLTLLVGTLSSKVDTFDSTLGRFDDYFASELTENLETLRSGQKDIKAGMESLDGQMDGFYEEQKTLSNSTQAKFTRVQRNFTILNQGLGDFTQEDYVEFKNHVMSELRTLRDAIFAPTGDSDSDSEYVDGY